MRCSEIMILLATRRDLALAQEHEVRAHLGTCARCAAAWSREERTTRVLRSLPLPPVTPPPARVGAAVQGMLARKRPRPRRWSYGLALAGAALGVILLGMLFNQQADSRATQPPAVAPSSIGAQLSPTPDGQPNVQPDTQPTPNVQPTPDVQLSPTPSAPPNPTPITPTPSIAPTAITPTPAGTPTPPPLNGPGWIAVSSHALQISADGNAITGSRLSILDAQTLQSLRAVEANGSANLITVLSPDRTRLYFAQQEQIHAIDLATQQTLWTTPAGGPVYYEALETSPDGRLLYIPVHAGGEAANVKLQIMDTTTGQVLPESIALAGCGSGLFFRPTSGTMLYVTCVEKMYRIDTTTQQMAQVAFPINASRSVLSQDGRLLYNFDEAQRKMQVIDLEQQTIVHEELIANQDPSLIIQGARPAFSGDGTTLVIALELRDRNNQLAAEFQVFDARTWSRKNVFTYEQPVNVHAIAMSHDGSTIYAAARVPQELSAYRELVTLNSSTGQVQATTIREEDIQQIIVVP